MAKGFTRREFLKLSGTAVAAAGALSAVSASHLITPPLASAELPPHPTVLVIGWDGADYRTLTNHSSLFPNVSSLNVVRLECAGVTVTKPGWVEILTGLDYDDSRVYTNEKYRAVRVNWTPFYKLASESGLPDYYQACILSKKKNTGDRSGEPWNNLRVWALSGGLNYYANASEVPDGELAFTTAQTYGHLQQAIASLTRPAFVVCHFAEPDEAGHIYGMDSSQYIDAMQLLDQILGEVISSLQPDVVIACSDHGFFSPGSYNHGNAPNGFVASNLPLVANCIRRDIGYTLATLLKIKISLKRPKMRGKILLA